MVDEVDRLIDEVGLDDVEVVVHELRRADVLDVGQRAGLEVVDADHAMAAPQQLLAEVRAEEAGAAGDEAGGHGFNLPAIGRDGPGQGRLLPPPSDEQEGVSKPCQAGSIPGPIDVRHQALCGWWQPAPPVGDRVQLGL